MANMFHHSTLFTHCLSHSHQKNILPKFLTVPCDHNRGRINIIPFNEYLMAATHIFVRLKWTSCHSFQSYDLNFKLTCFHIFSNFPSSNNH
ncbi:hypothetical protein BpHYR1_047742 [Brachionus plicatilis]|uniref:Uncharacterized protein n=1 Tax=Brachionus plicatilis TaxID=10195 RepID=A0A3M7R0S8_BRAPC|nr:hypothetical protein BpHYR1_047742 [Brachionus plicatilis]